MELAPNALFELKKNYELARQTRVRHWQKGRGPNDLSPELEGSAHT
jgi:hypothetical protein